MKRSLLAATGSLSFGIALLASACVSITGAAAPAQALTASPSTAPESPADRSKALNALFNDIWQDNLKHSPEYASTLGDKRYNDQLTDYSAKAVNASLERGRDFITRLSAIDTTGLPDQEQLSAQLMLRSLIEQQEGARFKEWEMPVDQFNGFQLAMPHPARRPHLRLRQGLR